MHHDRVVTTGSQVKASLPLQMQLLREELARATQISVHSGLQSQILRSEPRNSYIWHLWHAGHLQETSVQTFLRAIYAWPDNMEA